MTNVSGKLITPSIAAAMLDYDPQTGRLTWKSRPREMFTSDGQWKRWNTVFAGKLAATQKNSNGYVNVAVFGRTYKAHRLAMMIATGECRGHVDHINGVRSDNRLENLRWTTPAQNARNSKMRVDNTSGKTGVTFCKKNKKWKAQLQINGKCFSLGLFDTVEKAAAKRDAANAEFNFSPRHGEKAEKIDENRLKV